MEKYTQPHLMIDAWTSSTTLLLEGRSHVRKRLALVVTGSVFRPAFTTFVNCTIV